MEMMVLDPEMQEHLIAQRQAWGGDRFDEVWEGVYMMAPLPNNEHQDIQGRLSHALHASVAVPDLGIVLPGANVSDREREDWVKNYRCPDIVVVLKNGTAKDCDTHWFGGPDFAVEIVSLHDRSRDRFDFYASVGVRELLLIDRFPWSLELHHLVGDGMELAGRTVPGDGVTLRSSVVPDSFRLVPGNPRPRIEVTHHDGVQRWLV
jgi:Uma2 family endonuclease